MKIEVPHGYEALAAVFCGAIHQAAYGKGRERHANGAPFLEQRIMRLQEAHGQGFALGQAQKKLEESVGMTREARERELLGALNYIAAALLHENLQYRKQPGIAQTPAGGWGEK